MEKIIILSDAANIHTKKWATFFRDKSYDVHVISLLPADIIGVDVHVLKSKAYAKRKNNMQYNKIAVLFEILPQIKKHIKEINPKIIHAHFASSFGFFAALTNFHPFYLSVWGSDVVSFPEKTPIHKAIIKFTLKKADKIFATTDYLANQTARFTNKKQIITPFGVDINKFKPLAKNHKDKFIIGTVKALEKVYGIEFLLMSVALLKDKIDQLELWIAGKGTEKENLINLAKELGIIDIVKFLGRVNHSEVPSLINQMDVFTVTSEYESFGVAAVEAEACGIPVVASNVGGLSEVIIDGVTGFHVKPRDPDDIADKIYKLYKDSDLRKRMGLQGRKNVLKKYVWQENAQTMLDNYEI